MLQRTILTQNSRKNLLNWIPKLRYIKREWVEKEREGITIYLSKN